MASSGEFVEDLFEAALSLSDGERVELLDHRCEGAPELRRAVEVLLAANDQAGSFLDRPFLAPPAEDVPSTLKRGFATDNLGGDENTIFRVGVTLVGRFTLHRFIARGGMGEVWEAWDSQVQERVAIKTIRPDFARHPEAVERFRLEVKQARAISNPNVCRIHELFTFEAKPGSNVMFLCMEFLEGPTLSEYLRHNGPFPPNVAYKLVQQLVHGLNSAHSQGVVHRDLKSKNIMLVNSGPGTLRAVITDFGLALNVLAPGGRLQERKDRVHPTTWRPSRGSQET
jgi:serine/threonine protein kinase